MIWRAFWKTRRGLQLLTTNMTPRTILEKVNALSFTQCHLSMTPAFSELTPKQQQSIVIYVSCLLSLPIMFTYTRPLTPPTPMVVSTMPRHFCFVSCKSFSMLHYNVKACRVCSVQRHWWKVIERVFACSRSSLFCPKAKIAHNSFETKANSTYCTELTLWINLLLQLLVGLVATRTVTCMRCGFRHVKHRHHTDGAASDMPDNVAYIWRRSIYARGCC